MFVPARKFLTKKNALIILVVVVTMLVGLVISFVQSPPAKKKQITNTVKKITFQTLLPQERKASQDESLIKIEKNSLSPQMIKVSPQKIVVFRNVDSRSHTLASENYTYFASPEISPQSEFTFVFKEKGTWVVYFEDNKEVKAAIVVE